MPKPIFLIYGMGEGAIITLTKALERGESPHNIRGVCYVAKEPRKDYLMLPSHKECLENKEKYLVPPEKV